MVGQSEGQLFCGVSITTHRYTQVIAMLLRLHKAIIPVHSDPRDLPVTFRSELYLPVVRQQDAEDNQQNPQARRDRHAADQNNSVTKSIEHNANHRNYEDFRRRPRKGGGTDDHLLICIKSRRPRIERYQEWQLSERPIGAYMIYAAYTLGNHKDINNTPRDSPRVTL